MLPTCQRLRFHRHIDIANLPCTSCTNSLGSCQVSINVLCQLYIYVPILEIFSTTELVHLKLRFMFSLCLLANSVLFFKDSVSLYCNLYVYFQSIFTHSGISLNFLPEISEHTLTLHCAGHPCLLSCVKYLYVLSFIHLCAKYILLVFH